MKKKIRPAKELYENLVRDSSDIIISVDLDRKVIVFNPAAEKAFGFTKEEIIGKHVNMLYADPSQGLHVHKATKEISTFEGEIVNRRKDGSTFISQLSTGVLHNEEGNVIGVMGISRDITKKKLEEDELAKLLQKSLLHVQQAPLAVIEWNTNFEVTEWNPAAEKIFGYRKEEALGHHAEFIIHEAAKEHVDVVWQSLLSQQGGVRSTNENITKDGNILFCEWYNTPLVSESGEVLGVASLAHDITEVKLADEKLKLLNETLEQRVAERTVELKEKNIVLNKEIAEREKMEEALLQSEKLKSLGIITAGIAHEFNNILAVMMGRAEVLEGGFKDDKELKKGLNSIINAGEDGAEIVRNMLTFAGSKTSPSEYAFFDIRHLIKEAIDFIKPRWENMAQAKGTDYIIDKEGMREIPEVLCNPTELREVFTNIINNALDAMPDGGSISISTWSNEGNVFVSVSDTGKGMPENVTKRVFDPFFTTRRPLGTGLGMSVSYGVIVRHGGRIEVESEEGKGTTFNLSIPIGKDAVQNIEQSESARQVTTRKLHILVVDDSEEMCVIVDRFLTKGGHTVKTIDNGAGAIALAGKEDFDLVLCDLAMPDVYGYDVINIFNELSKSPKIGIMTGWDETLKPVDDEDYKVDFILKKPFKHSELVKHINELFGADS